MDSNSTICKINKSRTKSKILFRKEWKVEDIKDYSDLEIEKIYKSSQNINNGINFGAILVVILHYITK